jgi:hypothetical protein
VGEVSIHLDDDLRTFTQGAVKPRGIGRPETLLVGPVHHGHPRFRDGETIGYLAGAIGGRVIDDEQAITLVGHRRGDM